jgi:hypothetical protein
MWVAVQTHRRIHGISTFRRLVGIWPDGFYKIYTDEAVA